MTQGPENDTHDHGETLDHAAASQTIAVAPGARMVYCSHCGVQLEGLRIGEPCPNCRQLVGSAGTLAPKSNGLAIASMVLGICSFVGCMMYGVPGIVCGILAIVFARKVRRGVASGEMSESSLGMATAGRVCGITGLCLSILSMVAMIGWLVYVFAFMVPQQQQWQQQQWQQVQQPSQPAPSLPAPTNPATQDPSLNP
jgi:hypothetical protein